MDITLERILSLLARNEEGKIKHGEQAKFARNIGYDSGDIVSMWKNGTSTSYTTKIHEISAKYNVSVKWLLGETDIKEPATLTGDGALEQTVAEILNLYRQLCPENKKQVLDYARFLLSNQESADDPLRKAD